jgi:DNA-binding transcriptional LysR family regulator
VGVAVLVELDVSSEIEAGEFRFIKLKDRDIGAPYISLVVPKRRTLSPAAPKFLDFLKCELTPGRNGSLYGIAPARRTH